MIEVPGLGSFSVYTSARCAWMEEGRPALLGIRPEKIWMSKRIESQFAHHIMGRVESIVYHGPSTQYNIRLKNNERVEVFEQNEEHFPKEKADYDDHVYLHWQKKILVLLER